MKKIFLILFSIILVIAVVCSLLYYFVFRKINFSSNKSDGTTKISNDRGFSISPKSFDVGDYQNFYSIVSKNFEYLTWSGDWIELCETKNAPYEISKTAKSKNIELIPIAQIFQQSTGKLLRPLTAQNKTQLQDCLKKFVTEQKPKYLGIGIEINILFEKSPNDFNEFVNTFNETISYIKKDNPNTKFFTIFQLERMKGLKGGLFGGKNNTKYTNWDLLTKFEKADLFAFTTYPYLIFDNPDELQNDYYQEISKITSKPVAFTEIGWPSGNSPNGWKSNEDEQNQFIEKFNLYTKDVNSEFEIWSFLYDQPNSPEPFKNLGLYDSSNKPKKGFSSW